MQVNYIIVGQGICGTMLSWYLHKEGKTFVVIDKEKKNSPSKVAAGMINPVTGRRYVTTWMIETLLPFAKDAYKELGVYFNKELVTNTSIVDFFPTVQMRDAFINSLTSNDTYLHAFPDQNHYNQYFNYNFGCGEISPALIINVPLLIEDWRKKLSELNALVNEPFLHDELQLLTDGVNYHGITAEKIIFCEGPGGMNNPWFNKLPFSFNKGEVLIIESEHLTNEHIFKKGITLVPLPVKNTYWVGSNYEWNYQNEHVSPSFYQDVVQQLEAWLKLPFEVVMHKAAIRPAALERRPFVGFHPQFPNIGIMNGMGTKGTSLAPFFANQLTQHLVYQFPILEEADVNRFRTILSK